MTSGTTWKNKERVVASWFGSQRNPLSGRNNVDDKGERRLGDVVHPEIIEVKLRAKNGGVTRAKDTAKQAKDNNRAYLHVEYEKGANEPVGLFLSQQDAAAVCKFLDTRWKALRSAREAPGKVEVLSMVAEPKYVCFECRDVYYSNLGAECHHCKQERQHERQAHEGTGAP